MKIFASVSFGRHVAMKLHPLTRHSYLPKTPILKKISTEIISKPNQCRITMQSACTIYFNTEWKAIPSVRQSMPIDTVCASNFEEFLLLFAAALKKSLVFFFSSSEISNGWFVFNEQCDMTIVTSSSISRSIYHKSNLCHH